MNTASSSPRPTIRGAIRATVTTSRDALIAGDNFSVFVKVQNPFEVPLRLLGVSAFVPVEFYDLEARRRSMLARTGQLTSALGRGTRALLGLLRQSRAAELAEEEATEVGQISAHPIGGDPGGGAAFGVLQPGNSATAVFTLCSRHERRFRPGTYRMQVSVRYCFEDGEAGGAAALENTDVIEVALDVRASVSSILLGGAIGCVAGWLAAHLQELSIRDLPAALAHLLVTVLGTVGLLLLFARKKEVQPLLSVEDAYGGALIGFLVGLNGAEAVGQQFGVQGV